MIKDNQVVKYASRHITYYHHRLLKVVNVNRAYLQQAILCETFELNDKDNLVYLPLRIQEFADGLKAPKQMQFVSLYNTPPMVEYFSSSMIVGVYIYNIDKYNNYYKLRNVL